MHLQTRTVLCSLLPAVTFAGSLDAQKRDRGGDHHRTTYAIEAFGGGVDFGHFLKLETAPPTGTDPAAEQKLQAERTFAVGGALTVQPWPKAAIRAGVAFAPGHFELRDDSGIDSDQGDEEDVGGLDLWTFDLSVLYSALDPDGTVVPYAIGGVSAGLWRTDAIIDPDAIIALVGDGTESQIRIGGVGGAGLRINASESVAFRLEFATFAIGNPFDGNDAFVLDGSTDRKIDEPSVTRVSRLTAGVLVKFGGAPERRGRRRGR